MGDFPLSYSFILSITDPQLVSNIRNSTVLSQNIRQLALSRTSTPSSSIGGTPHSHRSQSQSYQETETGDGQGEIQLLARRILEITEGDGDGSMTPSAAGISRSHADSADDRSISLHGRDHEELRKSVREAFAGGSTRD